MLKAGERMKRVFLIAAAFILGFSLQANATLIVRGTDTLGNRLIFDSDLGITWYDFSHQGSWTNQVNWASGLSITLGSNTYNDWRLPTALNPDGTGPCSGFNCTGSEMGHLYYTELNNIGEWANPVNTGPFQNLTGNVYWFSDPGPGGRWAFILNNWYGHNGEQFVGNTGFLVNNYALAVRGGDVSTGSPSSVPEPSPALLVGAGLIGLVAFISRSPGGWRLRRPRTA